MGHRKTKNAVRILDREIGDDRELRSLVSAEHLNVRVARMIADGRREAGLTQKQLAELVGTTQSAIARLEDADYEGHSLSMLQRIANALGVLLHVEFEAKEPEEASARPSVRIAVSARSVPQRQPLPPGSRGTRREAF